MVANLEYTGLVFSMSLMSPCLKNISLEWVILNLLSSVIAKKTIKNDSANSEHF